MRTDTHATVLNVRGTTLLLGEEDPKERNAQCHAVADKRDENVRNHHAALSKAKIRPLIHESDISVSDWDLSTFRVGRP